MSNTTHIPAADYAWLHPAAFMEPSHLTHPAPWAGHIPFAAWLIAVAQPRVLVELGAYSGISYMAFCQAITEQGLFTRAYAVDTWEGDAHAGAYGEHIYNSLRQAHDPHYARFSTLMRMRFDEALGSFADGSVDLLHIDGLHTYEAVRHDFETWLPKLSERGVVLFHDSNVYRDDFGVHRLWAELQDRYPSLHFAHSNGLGVLLVGPQQPAPLLALCTPPDVALQHQARTVFSTLGARLEHRADLLMLGHQLGNAQQQAQQLEAAGQQRHAWIEKLDGDILELERSRQQLGAQAEEWKHSTQHAQDTLGRTQGELDRAQNELKQLRQWSQQTQERLEQARIESAKQQWQIEHQAEQMQALARQLSLRWRMTDMLRKLKGAAFALRLKLARYEPQPVRKVRHAARRRLRQALGQAPLTMPVPASASKHVGIMATAHTQFIAHGLARVLRKAGFTVTLYQEAPAEGFGLGMYIVVCPQMFAQLPPGERRIVFQMEQSVSPRWFTAEYLATLENSLAAWDYAETNLAFLETKGIRYPHTYLVPIGGIPDYSQVLAESGEAPLATPPAPTHDVLFYGDVNAPRRQQMLQELQRHFSVRIEGNLFGAALRDAVRQARVVANIHYYEGALLETTRIYECLSLGVPVVTESSADIQAHALLAESQAVRITPVGDAQAMVRAIQEVLQQQAAAPAELQQAVQAAVQRSSDQFEFMAYRALYALGRIDTDQWDQLTETQDLPGTCLALSMPETTRRREHFVQKTRPGLQGEVTIFNGVRHSPGWLGCAMSYHYLARKALQAGVDRIEVMEDDVEMPPGYTQRRHKVDAWLQQHEGQWDIFAGLIAKIHPDTRVLDVQRHDGETFVVLDRMTSMVHNIYARPALQALSEWNAHIRDPHTNTIDSYLQGRAQMRVVTTLPFLVAHTTEMDSSLWGINNQEYLAVIYKAEQDLRNLVDQFEPG
ncbi:hypothetical protein GCM10027082_33360 [Comamonas humi]